MRGGGMHLPSTDDPQEMQLSSARSLLVPY